MQWPLLLGTWGYHLPGCKDPYIPAPGVTSASNSGPFVAGRARIDPCSAPPPVTGVKVSPVPSLGESNVTGPTRSVWSTTQPQGPVRGLLVAHYVVLPATLAMTTRVSQMRGGVEIMPFQLFLLRAGCDATRRTAVWFEAHTDLPSSRSSPPEVPPPACPNSTKRCY